MSVPGLKGTGPNKISSSYHYSGTVREPSRHGRQTVLKLFSHVFPAEVAQILGLTRIENDVPERFSATVIYMEGERWLPN